MQSAEGRSCSAPLVCGWLPRNKKIRSSKQEKQSTLKMAVMLCSVCIYAAKKPFLYWEGREKQDDVTDTIVEHITKGLGF